jgi:thiol:disulfide interchange protein DsbD
MASLRAPLVTAFMLCWVATATHAQTSGRRPIAGLSPIVESTAVHADTLVRAAVRVQLPDGFHVNSDQPRDPSLFPLTMTVDAAPMAALIDVSFPAPSDLTQQGDDAPLRVFQRTFTIGARLQLSGHLPIGDLHVPVHIKYQACDQTRCYVPATVDTTWTWSVVAAAIPLAVRQGAVFRGMTFRPAAAVPDRAAESIRAMPLTIPAGDSLSQLDAFTVAGTGGGYLSSAQFLSFVRQAETGGRAGDPFQGRGPLGILLLVLAGGLALNLTPCVLPMIPINLAIIGAGVQARSRARGFLLGSLYGGAMAAVYGGLGLVVVLTAGTFGAINASPWFNATIAVLFIALALAMFDVFFLDLSRYSTRLHLGASRGSSTLALGMGAVAALLAGACVAPVVIQVVLFSTERYASGARTALALPFVLGLGMAAPWPLAGAGLAALPRPGSWMVRVKQAFGVVILAMAAYYGYTAYDLLAGRAVDRAAATSAASATTQDGWHASLADGLAIAQRDRKLVLVDLWATWCKNCVAMDHTTLADPAVAAATAAYVKIKFQAEDPDDPRVREVLRRFGAVGLPTYVVLRPAP